MKKSILLAALAGVITASAMAGETSIGEPVVRNGMEIAAVYLQPVMMEPHDPGHDDADAHIEADIRALKSNGYGFGEGEWIPYLDIEYGLTKVGSDWRAAGRLIPMVASDGPHYGANVKFDGPGTYRVAYTVRPAAHDFLRHVDRETGVNAWWKPFTVTWDFAFAGAGKKGGY